MPTTNLRKVGGSVMLALPPAILDLLNLRADVTVGLAVDGNRLVIEAKPGPRYALAELLATSDYTEPMTGAEREWIDGPAVSRELI